MPCSTSSVLILTKCHKDTDARWTKKRGEKHYGYKLRAKAATALTCLLYNIFRYVQINK